MMPLSSIGSYTTPDGQKVGVEDIVKVYKDAYKNPIVNNAVISSIQNDIWTLQVKSSLHNTDLMQMESISQSYLLTKDGMGFKIHHVSSGLSNASVLAEDDRAGSKVVLRKEKDKDKNSFSITWYRDGDFVKSVKLLDFELHGPVVTSDPFSTLKLSNDGTRVLYLAEKKEPKAKSFFAKDRKPASPENSASSLSGNEYLFKENWGEGLTDVYSTVICVLDLEKETLDVTQMDNFSLHSPFWIDNKNDEIGFVAIRETPKKLGLIHCTNRASALCKRSLSHEESSFLTSSSANITVSSPRMSPVKSQVIYIRNSSGGAHSKANEVILYDMRSGSEKTLCSLDACLYHVSLPQNCWHSDGSVVYFNSQSRGELVLWQLHIIDGSLKRVSAPLPSACFKSIKHGIAAIVASSFIAVPQLFICDFTDPHVVATHPVWIPVTKSFRFDSTEYQMHNVQPNVQAFLLSPSHLVDKPAACIIVPHGGPHSTFCNTFIPSAHVYTRLGFKVLLINYRGSTGMSEEDLHSLPGKCGQHDVADCLQVIEFFQSRKLINSSELFLNGGSHGGFLVCHLSSQFPERSWVALVARNPVTNLASLESVSDIPDWCWFETFGNDDYFTKNVDEGVLSKMLSMSPMKHVARVKTPTLMLLGSEDRRVPMSQGLRWYESLKRAGVPTKCLVYPDGHALLKVPVNSDATVNIVLWFLHHLNEKKTS